MSYLPEDQLALLVSLESYLGSRDDSGLYHWLLQGFAAATNNDPVRWELAMQKLRDGYSGAEALAALEVFDEQVIRLLTTASSLGEGSHQAVAYVTKRHFAIVVPEGTVLRMVTPGVFTVTLEEDQGGT